MLSVDLEINSSYPPK